MEEQFYKGHNSEIAQVHLDETEMLRILILRRDERFLRIASDIFYLGFSREEQCAHPERNTCKVKSPSPWCMLITIPPPFSLTIQRRTILSRRYQYAMSRVMELFVTPSFPATRPRIQRTQDRTFPTCRRATWRDVVNTVPAAELRKNSLVVPRHLWDPRMRKAGVYRSVEYTIEKLSLDDKEIDSTYDIPPHRRRDIIASLRPLNTLLPRYERQWPVEVPLGEAVLWSYKRDLLRCTVVTLAMSLSFLTTGVVGPTVLGIYSIPSASMEPSLRIGDALLVEKVSLRASPPHRGEIVLFRPTNRLSRMVTDARLRRNDLFVKRVVATPGDIIEISRDGVVVNGVKVDKAAPGSPYVAPRVIPEGFVFVVGDNPDQSLDSRFLRNVSTRREGVVLNEWLTELFFGGEIPSDAAEEVPEKEFDATDESMKALMVEDIGDPSYTVGVGGTILWKNLSRCLEISV